MSMSDDESGFETELIDRRTVLAALGTATATGLAGCSGDSGSDDDDEEDEDDESDDTGTDGDTDPLVGRTRVRGRTDAGDYDAREHLSVADGRATVRTAATVESAAALPWDRYDVAEVKIALSFYDRPIATGTTLVDDAEVRDTRRRSGGGGPDGAVTYEFVPTGSVTKRRLAVGSRTTVEVDRGTDSLAYVGNARFRWRRSVGLVGGEWVAHTPGRRSWHGLDG